MPAHKHKHTKLPVSCLFVSFHYNDDNDIQYCRRGENENYHYLLDNERVGENERRTQSERESERVMDVERKRIYSGLL